VIIAIASGKGGTGKTTVAVSLALAVAQTVATGQCGEGGRVRVLDCDVEEPNVHLFLKPIIEAQQEAGVLTPVVDEGRCDLCGDCADVCAYHAMAVVGPGVLVFPELCHGCGSCALSCSRGAIREELRVTGVVEEGCAEGVFFVHGVLNVGEAMAVPLIRQVKKRASQAAAHDLVILDCPPGTACPVVECLRGADYALMVTEPTPFGLHDLELAVQVARDELKLPVGVVINRDGFGDHGVERYCGSEGIPIMMRLPLERRIAEACSEGVPVFRAFPEYVDRFVALHRRIIQEARACGR
jgi:MinD superfamily P-loop ATPase